MKVTGLITEYNPFHNGHEYHIQQAKEVTGADYVIAIMSGDFVQRGTPACVQKHIRAHMALLSGVDLVLELPLPYATGTAEVFSFGAVSILHQLGIVDTICFGAECNDSDLLMEAAQLLANEPDWYREALQKNLKKGLSFPAARAAALPEYAEVLGSPNNILGIEYCKALIRLHASIKPAVIERKGSAYHEESIPYETAQSMWFPSATALRKQIEQSEVTKLSDCIPPAAYAQLNQELQKNGYVHEDDFSQLLLYKLLSAKSHEDLLLYEDISEELASRIYKTRTQFLSFSQFADLLKTKEVTRTRINRALLHLLLGMKKNTVYGTYARILGFRKEAAPLLSEIKKNTTIPFFSKTAATHSILHGSALAAFNLTTDASLLYEGIISQKNKRTMLHEHAKPIIIV